MAILAECDVCGSQHRVKDGLVGSSIRCKDCGVMFAVLPGPVISTENYIDAGGRLRLRERIEDSSHLWPRIVAGFVTTLIIGALAGSIWAMKALIRPVSQNTRPATGVRQACSTGEASSKSTPTTVVKESQVNDE